MRRLSLCFNGRYGMARRAKTTLTKRIILQNFGILGIAEINDTAVRKLASCKALQTLMCQDTPVGSLAPLATCMENLCIIGTAVRSLDPLATCSALKRLMCNRAQAEIATECTFLRGVALELGYNGVSLADEYDEEEEDAWNLSLPR